MSTKEISQDSLQKLSEEISLSDVARKIQFVAAVRHGMAEVERGERIPLEDIDEDEGWQIGAYHQFCLDDFRDNLLEENSIDPTPAKLLQGECEAERTPDSNHNFDRQDPQAPFEPL